MPEEIFDNFDPLKSFNQLVSLPVGVRNRAIKAIKENLEIFPTADERSAMFLSAEYFKFNKEKLDQVKSLALAVLREIDSTFDPEGSRRNIHYKPELTNYYGQIQTALQGHTREEVVRASEQIKKYSDTPR